jgi:hypothetical protein
VEVDAAVEPLADVYHFGTQHFDPTSRSSPSTTIQQVGHRDDPTLPWLGLGACPARLNIRVIRWVYARQVDHAVDIHRRALGNRDHGLGPDPGRGPCP